MSVYIPAARRLAADDRSLSAPTRAPAKAASAPPFAVFIVWFRRPICVGAGNAKDQERRVSIVGIGRSFHFDGFLRVLQPLLCEPGLALADPFQNLALGHAFAGNRILIGSMLLS